MSRSCQPPTDHDRRGKGLPFVVVRIVRQWQVSGIEGADIEVHQDGLGGSFDVLRVPVTMDPSAPLRRPVSLTALVCAWHGWSSAWPERVVGAAGPLADLAAPVSLGLAGIPGPLRLRGRGRGQPPLGAEDLEFQVRPGQPPMAFGPWVEPHRGGAQVLDPAGPGELVHIGGDAADDRPHQGEVDGHDGPV